MTPLERMADPGEIGAAAAFPRRWTAASLTASEVAVDGGLDATLTLAFPRLSHTTKEKDHEKARR